MDTFITIIGYILCIVGIAIACMLLGGFAYIIGNTAKECADKGDKFLQRLIVVGASILAAILIMAFGKDEYREIAEEHESIGYEKGYDEGHHEGYELGCEEAYDSGYDSGYEDGYSDGEYADCIEEYRYGYSVGYYDGNNKLEYNDEY